MYCSIGNVFLHNSPFDETGLWRAASLALINTLQSGQEQMEMPHDKKKNCWVIKEASGVLLLFWAIMTTSPNQAALILSWIIFFFNKIILSIVSCRPVVKMPEATWLGCRLRVLGPKSRDVFTSLKVLLQGLPLAGLSSHLLSLLLPLFLFSSEDGLLLG